MSKARFIEGQDKTEAAIKEQELATMKEQHSADLRAVAEMAIRGCSEAAWGQFGWPTADSIVREFREKKAKVGK